MKSTLVYIITAFLLFTSCKAHKLDEGSLNGVFVASVKNGKGLPGSYYTLNLYPDSTFVFDVKVHLGNSGCKGRWNVITASKVILSCIKPKDPAEVLTSGNMGPTEEVQIVSANKLKYKDVILRRVRS